VVFNSKSRTELHCGPLPALQLQSHFDRLSAWSVVAGIQQLVSIR